MTNVATAEGRAPRSEPSRTRAWRGGVSEREPGQYCQAASAVLPEVARRHPASQARATPPDRQARGPARRDRLPMTQATTDRTREARARPYRTARTPARPAPRP